MDKEQWLSIVVAKREGSNMLKLQQELGRVAGMTRLKFGHVVPTPGSELLHPEVFGPAALRSRHGYALEIGLPDLEPGSRAFLPL